jgi:predicted nucleic acid-binding protein
MRVLLGTNILLDVLLDRSPWSESASEIWSRWSDGQLDGHICATSLTDIFYVARRLTDLPRARTAVRLCLQTFAICPVDRTVLNRADSMAGSDFEDNVQLACALINGIEVIVRRDPTGFDEALIAILSADELLRRLAADVEGGRGG